MFGVAVAAHAAVVAAQGRAVLDGARVPVGRLQRHAVLQLHAAATHVHPTSVVVDTVNARHLVNTNSFIRPK